MQVDSGNAMMEGAAPVVVLRRYPRRFPAVHLKGHEDGDTDLLIGERNLDWQAYLSAYVKSGGCRWFNAEIENPRMDNMDAAQRRLENLKKLLDCVDCSATRFADHRNSGATL